MSRAKLFAALAFFIVTLLATRWVYEEHRLLYDTDASFHLAIGQLYAEQGFVDTLPQLRFSLLRDGFGDKEFLFHALLAPFAAQDDAAVGAPMSGGRWALAFFNALVLTVVALAAMRAVGWWGVLVPLILMVAAPEWNWRLIRLRPELWSLALLIVGLWAAASRRARLLGAVALLYTLGYTAFHAFVGLIGLIVLWWAWSRRRIEWPLVLYTGLGAAVALVIHPHFPTNLEVWVIQNIDFFLAKGSLDVGTEILPNTTAIALTRNLGWWLGLLVVWFASTPRQDDEPRTDDLQNDEVDDDTNRRLAEAFTIATIAFGILYLLMSRFSLYALPLTTLAVLFTLRARGRRLGAWLILPGHRRVPVVLAVVLIAVVSLPSAGREWSRFTHRANAGPEDVRLVERKDFAAALPDGARVVAPWGQTALYMLWAPHGRYLNVLDPVFMARPHPEAHQAQDRIWQAIEPDIPLATVTTLDSQFIAYSLVGRPARLTRRLFADPRVKVRHNYNNLLFEILDDSNDDFVLDWRLVPASASLPPDNTVSLDGWPRYPRARTPQGQRVEGFVDGSRVGAVDHCLGFVRDEVVDADTRIHWALAPWGPTRLWLNGEPMITVEDSMHAALGEEVMLPVTLTAGRHRLTVVTCADTEPDAITPGHVGFYLLERAREAINTAPPETPR
ncbi:MAG: hypothetical protein AAGD38_00110 [Acidobacteriota bacterium]